MINNRNIYLDILRILAMLGIVGLHLMCYGGVIDNLETSNINLYFVLIIYILCSLSVNIFAMLSGLLS